MLAALRVLLGGYANKQVVGVPDPAGEQSCHLLGDSPSHPQSHSSSVTDLQHFLQLKCAAGAALEEAMVTVRLAQASCGAGRSGSAALCVLLQAQCWS